MDSSSVSKSNANNINNVFNNLTENNKQTTNIFNESNSLNNESLKQISSDSLTNNLTNNSFAEALKNIPKFASGGFSGDNQLAFLNRNELILKPQEQVALYNVLKSNEMGSITNNPTKDLLTDGIVGEVILRGTTQVIQLKRAEKKMSRYYNS